MLDKNVMFDSQVLLKASAYVAITTYGVMSLIATVAALVLPIETKGRELKVCVMTFVLALKFYYLFSWISYLFQCFFLK